jgi:hypothetical protein
MGQCWPDGYSAHVEVYLLINTERINIAQIGNGSFILRDAHVIPPSTTATLVVKVDDKEEREEIFIRDGVTSNRQRVPYF